LDKSAGRAFLSRTGFKFRNKMGSARSRPIAPSSSALSHGRWQMVRQPAQEPWQVVTDDAYDSGQTATPSSQQTPWQLIQDPRVVPVGETWVEPQPRLSMARGQQGRPVVDPQLPWWQRRRQWEAFESRRAAARQQYERRAAMRRIRGIVPPRERPPQPTGMWAATAERLGEWLG